MGAPANSDWLAPIARHRHRRAQGIPTVTILSGERRVAAWIWGASQRSAKHPGVVARGTQPDEVLAQWIAGPSTLLAARAATLAMIANAEGVSVAELMSRLAGRSAWQLDALADRLAPELQLESWLVRLALGFAPGVATPLLGVASLRNVERLLGELPPLLVDPAEPSTDALSHAARMLVELAEAVPRADLALAVDGSLLTPLSATLRGRLATAFAEGLILLHESVGEPLNATHPAAAFIEYSGASFARSRAEMKLFELLNDRERTKGLFSLNRKLEPLDDGTVLEVDLLCQDLMLAVEVDGYHHFRDAGGYRRDRRKDVRLQDLGYLVVRVLAADVEDEISHVIETIDAVVDRRRRRTE